MHASPEQTVLQCRGSMLTAKGLCKQSRLSTTPYFTQSLPLRLKNTLRTDCDRCTLAVRRSTTQLHSSPDLLDTLAKSLRL